MRGMQACIFSACVELMRPQHRSYKSSIVGCHIASPAAWFFPSFIQRRFCKHGCMCALSGFAGCGSRRTMPEGMQLHSSPVVQAVVRVTRGDMCMRLAAVWRGVASSKQLGKHARSSTVHAAPWPVKPARTTSARQRCGPRPCPRACARAGALGDVPQRASESTDECAVYGRGLRLPKGGARVARAGHAGMCWLLRRTVSQHAFKVVCQQAEGTCKEVAQQRPPHSGGEMQAGV